MLAGRLAGSCKTPGCTISGTLTAGAALCYELVSRVSTGGIICTCGATAQLLSRFF